MPLGSEISSVSRFKDRDKKIAFVYADVYAMDIVKIRSTWDFLLL